MSKDDGLKIGIKFTADLIGDVTGNVSAFTISGKEYKYVNGELIDGEYVVEKVERYYAQKRWESDFDGTLSDVIINSSGCLELSEGFVEDYSENIAVNKTYFASSEYSSSYKIEYPYNASTSQSWLALNAGVPQWNGIDYDIGNGKIIKRIQLQNVEADRVKGFDFQGSNDNSSWDTIYSGEQPNNKNLITHDFNNSTSYRYYRVYVTSQHTNSRVGLTFIKQFEVMQIPGGYKEEGAYISSKIILVDDLRFKADTEIPQDTDIIFEISEDEETWEEIEDGNIIEAGQYYVRATLSTEDEEITPTLKRMWLEEPSAPQDRILLTMDWWKKFNNIEGKLKVEYDATKGTLTGSGGAVESFEVEFTPEDLVQTPNPGIQEYLKAYPYEIDLSLKDLEFAKGYADEYLKAYPYSIVLDLKDIGEINP